MVHIYEAQRAGQLRGLPFVAHPTDPSRHPTFALIGGNMASTPDNRRNHSLQRYLHIGTDCAVIFYLTGEESYARCAADILSTATRALALMPRNDASESGGIVWYGEILRHAHASCQRSAEATNIGQMTSAEGEGK